jgi:peroxiredoxin
MEYMKLLLITILSLFFEASIAQNTVKINGTAPMLKNGTIIQLKEVNPNSKTANVHEIPVRNGNFSKVIATGFGDRFQLTLGEYLQDIFIDPGIIHIRIPDTTLKLMSVKNSKSATESDLFESKLMNLPSRKSYAKASSEYFTPTVGNIDSLNRLKFINDSLRSIYTADRVRLSTAYIKSNPNSFINSYILTYISDEISQDEFISLFSLLNSKTLNNKYGIYLKFKADNLLIGSLAPDFVQADTSGNQISLKDFRGKFVLLDFWASWCLPCRADNPNLVKAKERFKGKNFEIISVSLDADRSKWANAIRKDGLDWTQVSDLKDWNNEVGKKYKVNAIPDNFILDPTGKIIARRVHGEQLLKFLDAHIN